MWRIPSAPPGFFPLGKSLHGSEVVGVYFRRHVQFCEAYYRSTSRRPAGRGTRGAPGGLYLLSSVMVRRASRAGTAWLRRRRSPAPAAVRPPRRWLSTTAAAVAEPPDAAARRAQPPVVAYAVENLPKVDSGLYGRARETMTKIDEVVVPPRDGRAFDVPAACAASPPHSHWLPHRTLLPGTSSASARSRARRWAT